MAENIKLEPAFKVNGIFPAYLAIEDGFDCESIPENFAYVLDGSGWKLFKRNGISVALINVDSVNGVVALEQNIRYTASKLPLDLIRKVTSWFKAVYKKHKSEAVGYLYYKDSEWDFVPPTQTATGVSADYDKAPKREGWQIVGTIHSHGTMSAFHSGTDDADEEFFDGVHITIGCVDSVPEYSCSIVVQGKRAKYDPSSLINGMAPANDIPDEWLQAVKESAPRGLDPLFQVKAEKLYKAYYSSKISEAQYKKDLKKMEKEEAAYRKKKQEELAKQKEDGATHVGGSRVWPPRDGERFSPHQYGSNQIGEEDYENFKEDPLDFPPADDDETYEMVGVGMKGSKNSKRKTKRSRKYGKK